MKQEHKDLSEYDVYKVLKHKLNLTDVLMLKWVDENIKNGRLQEEKMLGKSYYLVTFPLIREDLIKYIPEIIGADGLARRMKVLATQKIVETVNGHFMSREFGYCTFAIRINFKEYKNLLREEL